MMNDDHAVHFLSVASMLIVYNVCTWCMFAEFQLRRLHWTSHSLTLCLCVFHEVCAEALSASRRLLKHTLSVFRLQRVTVAQLKLSVQLFHLRCKFVKCQHKLTLLWMVCLEPVLIWYDMVDFCVLISWRDGQLNLAHVTETKNKEKIKTKTD